MPDKQSILIVDDSDTNLLLLEAVLDNKGWDIHKTRSAKAGMEKVRTIMPDLILLDLLMPQIDGYAMLDWLQSEEEYRHIPVIVISAVKKNNTRNMCLKRGAVDYMAKPIDIAALLTMIRNILSPK